jgi:hypothetical protein
MGGRNIRPLPKKPLSDAVWGQQLCVVSKKCDVWTLRDVGGFSDRTLETFGLPGATRPAPGQGENQRLFDSTFP